MNQAWQQWGTVGVLMGGCSSEREISLKSGNAIVSAFQKAGVRVKPVDLNVSDPKKITEAVKAAQIDIAFIALHGRGGEDGIIQQILEDAGMPYTGSGVRASRMAFDKVAAQTMFRINGLPVAEFAVIRQNQAWDVDKIIDGLHGLPVVVKPGSEGSSIGVTLVEDRNSLTGAVAKAFEYSSDVLIEQFIPGREATAGILDRTSLPLVEIRPHSGFFDFQSKYQKGLTEYFVPAPFPPEVTAQIQQLALRAHELLGCEGFSRVDFRVDPGMRPFILEVNTIPGFTETSLFPKAARQAGLEFLDVCVKLVELAYGKKTRV